MSACCDGVNQALQRWWNVLLDKPGHSRRSRRYLVVGLLGSKKERRMVRLGYSPSTTGTHARMVVPEHMYPSLSPAPLTGSMSHCWSGPPSIHTMTVFHTTATLCSQALAYICIFHVCIVDVDELCRPIVAALCAWIVCHLRLPYRLHL